MSLVEKSGSVSKLRLTISVSLDGFVAGPRQSVEQPLGAGGERLHEWVFPLAAWRAPHGMEGGEVNESTPVVEEALANIGATVMGRNMFGGHPGPWNAEQPWTGWWGANPPFHHPVFVLTHHARAPLEFEGGTTFTFVTEGVEAALEQARHAAAGKDVSLAGGASVAQQYLAAGLVDEMSLHLVPVLLGSGARLFEGVGPDLHGLEWVRTIVAPKVTHLKFARRSKLDDDPAAVLAMFTDCHGRIARQCADLRELGPRLANDGGDTAARVAAAELIRFFDGLALHHHQDEERDLFPALIEAMAGSDAVCLRELTGGLTAEHRALDAAWERIRAPLQRAEAGAPVHISPEELDTFAALHQSHIECEERELLPMAARLIADDELARIGRAMRARRG